MELLKERVREDLVFLNVKGETSADVLRFISDELSKRQIVKETFYDALIQREKEFPTGLPIGEINVAIPHTYPDHINEVAVTIAILDKPVTFRNMGDPTQNVDVSIVLCMTMKKLDDNVKLLPELIGYFADENHLKQLLECKTPKAVIDLITH
ncbi:PTS sugar transporter subunit IIA [Alkalibacter rhizosphaerae]|uniref:PTS sugar transporter subunit IIA n=1 Tax=Alkalibacter rhizosphaerae TaxID=2815577 RepID=A0A975AJ61_9FIRM|nr:PTS sugar transporter subunit IIA [Alkalibacter rhizosphaerae]QSX09250.1 PTS sugar transporter subunit IIA [Alkalibacter rhizosphaerae]